MASEGLTDFRTKIHLRLVDLLNLHSTNALSEHSFEKRKQARFLIGNILDSYAHEIPSGLNLDHFIKEVLDHCLGLGILEDLLKDDEITEVMVNGPKQIYVEKKGLIQSIAKTFNNNREVMNVIEKIVAPLGRRIDEASPWVDARLPDGSRVNAIIPPLSLNGPCITIRKFKQIPFTAENLINNGSISKDFMAFLDSCVKARLNILISGGTGTGKTTLLNLLSSFIPKGERIITIEDAAELRLPQDHVISLESRPSNVEGKGEVNIRTLVRNALRMRPDRIVVGECRGGEALDMLQAMNTGHDGSLTTGHANGTRDILLRLETMVLMSGVELPLRAIREQIASAIQIIIQLGRFPDGSRKVTRVSEVCGMEGEMITLQDIFQWDNDSTQGLQTTGLIPACQKEFKKRGIPFPISIFTKKEQRL